MTFATKRHVTFFYAATVVAVGVWRQLQTKDSMQAVWFAVVVAAVAVVGALLLRAAPAWRKWLGYGLIALSLAFEAGWFLRRALTHETDGTSVRVLLILAVCAVQVVVLLWPVRGIAQPRDIGS